MTEPTIRVLSLGAGVQSTTLLLMACEGKFVPGLDAAIFADTRWEPSAVYRHLGKLSAAAAEAGIPVFVISKGDLRADLLNPDKMSIIPAFTLAPDGNRGMQGRKCTVNYKLVPIRRQTRFMLGGRAVTSACRFCDGTGQRIAPWRVKRGNPVLGTCSVCDGQREVTRVGQPARDRWAEAWVGFSTDEIGRVSSHADTRYSRSRYPLLELGMSRTQCEMYLRHRGWGSVAKSACIGCPYHGNRHWREMRDTRPADFADAVQFDEAYRVGAGMASQRFLHESCLPLAVAPIDKIQRREHEQLDLLDLEYSLRIEEGDPDGCSPYGCRSGARAGAA